MPVLDDILTEATASDAAWLLSVLPPNLNSVPCGANDFTATVTQRNLVQIMGATYGCHTCNQFIAATPQNFIVDHIPPRGFFPNPVAAGIAYLFYPHCDVCAATQAALVHNANGALTAQMRNWNGAPGARAALRVWLVANAYTPLQIALLTGGAGPSIAGHGAIPTAANRLAVNSLPGPITCHSCASAQASNTYHADHNPPVEFALTSWFPSLVRDLPRPNLVADAIFNALQHPFFRPQCPHCSHQQGGRCQALVNRSAALIMDLPLTATSSGRATKRVRYT
jgi:hypothetical protein